MTARPIIFSTPMVRAIIGGRKTQTRRVILPAPAEIAGLHFRHYGHRLFAGYVPPGEPASIEIMAPCEVDDVLWVRESFAAPEGLGKRIIYKADWSDEQLAESRAARRRNPGIARAYPDSRWRPSIHMPHAIARIFLRVTDVRVERLQEISEDDAKAEGVEAEHRDGRYWGWSEPFKDLWDSLNAGRGYGWQSNPWVWVITFERKD